MLSNFFLSLQVISRTIYYSCGYMLNGVRPRAGAKPWPGRGPNQPHIQIQI
jgi:hypothetical protein